MKFMTTFTLMASVLIYGCSMDPKHMEEDFGNSVRQMVQAQIHDPAAAAEPPLEGPDILDGVTAGTTVGEYRKDAERKRESDNSLFTITFD